MTTSRITNARYQIIILSDNAFLWFGLKTLITTMMVPRPNIFWINDVTPLRILHMREQIMQRAEPEDWLVFTDAARVSDLRVYLPHERVHILADNLTVAQLTRRLRSADFSSVTPPDAKLTRSELRVCTLISRGISLVGIARLLNKSPKTIYTHKRNAMSKFHCRNLAEFHRKICLLEQRSRYR